MLFRSNGMIEQARTKGLYDRLVVGEFMEFLRSEAEIAAGYHLIVAADVFVYASNLAPIADAAARVLAPEGFFAFTVETHAGAGVVLQPTLRYAHGEAHVRAALADAGLRPASIDRVSTRTENGVPVPGLLAISVAK